MKNKLTTSLVASFLIATNVYANDDLSSITISSATKSEQSIKDVTSNVNVITAQEIEEKNITTLTDALNLIPGISFTSNGGIGSTTNIMLRGTSNNRVLILIDGVRYKDHANISGTSISHLLINDIEKIEVVKGAQSGIWGADAAAGVINIITKSAKAGTNATASVEYGSYNTKQYGASISNKTDKYDLRLSANRFTNDGFSVQTPKGEDVDNYEDDAYENTTLNLKLGYNLTDSSKLKFNYTNIKAAKEYDSFGNPNDNTLKSDVDNNVYSFAFLQEFNNHYLTFNYDMSKFKRKEIGATFGVKQTEGKNTNIEFNDKISYYKNSFLLAGFGLSKENVFFKKTDNSTNDKESKGKFVYLTNSNHFDKLILTQSIRYDRYNNFDNKTTGKIGLKYNVKNDLSFFSNYGTAYSVPLMIKNLNPWGASNPDLEPETTKSFDLGVKYRDLTVTVFKTQVNNLIDWQGAGYTNVEGDSNFKGYEIEYSKDLLDDTLLSVNYTRLSAKNSDDENLSRRPSQTLKTSLDYYGLKNLHFNITSEYVGERYNSTDNKGVQTGKYVLWNGSINYDISKNIKTYIKLDNITNKNYQIVDGYATADRSAYVGLKVKF